MGYDYYFVITLEDTGPIKNDDDFYNNWRQQLIKNFNETINDGTDYTIPGKISHNCDGGYAFVDHQLKPTFVKFSECFPDLTFGLYCVLGDFEDLYITIYKNGKILKTNYIDLSFKINDKITIERPTFSSLRINNDISDLFNDDWDFDHKFNYHN